MFIKKKGGKQTSQSSKNQSENLQKENRIILRKIIPSLSLTIKATKTAAATTTTTSPSSK